MGKRTYESDIIAMALLYRKKYVGTDMISYDKVVRFDEVINDNLDKMNANCGIEIRNEEPSQLWFMVRDDRGNRCVVINPNVDLKRAWEFHIGCYPVEVCVASEMDNALKEIGLIVVDGKIVDRNTYYNELREKYNLRSEFEPQRFDFFRDWERIPEDGFVENFCISREEKCALMELRRNKQENQSVQEQEVSIIKRVKKM